MRLTVVNERLLSLNFMFGIAGRNYHFMFELSDLPEPVTDGLEIVNEGRSEAVVTVNGTMYVLGLNEHVSVDLTASTLKVINAFRYENYFMSNFHNAPIFYKYYWYSNAESAFQAQKCPGREDDFANLEGAEAKKLGRKVKLREDWEEVKDAVMFDVLSIKFEPYTVLSRRLMSTSPAILIEGNTWHDNHFGVCACERCKSAKKENKLGQMLMQIRNNLLSGKPIKEWKYEDNNSR